MRQTHHFIGLAALLAGVLTVDTEARAVSDSRDSPGADCYKTSPVIGLEGIWSGTIYNPSSTDDMTVMCPLSKMYSQINSAWISVFDRNSNLDVWCTIYTEYESGSQVLNVGNTQHSENWDTNAKTLSFGSLQALGDYYYAVCTIPRVEPGQWPSHVATIQVIEVP
jgi:hypothetical protein